MTSYIQDGKPVLQSNTYKCSWASVKGRHQSTHVCSGATAAQWRRPLCDWLCSAGLPATLRDLKFGAILQISRISRFEETTEQ